MRPLLLAVVALSALALSALALPACDASADEAPAFGDPYTVVASAGSPAVAEGRLTVDLAYSGGCETHAFVLRSRTDGDAAEVWLVHDSRGDSCEKAITETLRLAVPGSVAEAPRVTLLAPSGPIDVPTATR